MARQLPLESNLRQPSRSMTSPSRILPFLVGLLALPSAQAQRLPSASDFEAPAFELESIEGQQGWSVQQGFVEVREGVGRNGIRGLVIDPSLPFGQASLILDVPQTREEKRRERMAKREKINSGGNR